MDPSWDDDDDFVVPVSLNKSKSKANSDCRPNKPESFSCAKCSTVFKFKRNLTRHSLKCDLKKEHLHNVLLLIVCSPFIINPN